MKEEKTIYRCNRCGIQIDERIFSNVRGLFKKYISATMYEQTKYGYLDCDEIPLPDADCVVLQGVCGYQTTELEEIHFCRKCSKDFKKFMKNINV